MLVEAIEKWAVDTLEPFRELQFAAIRIDIGTEFHKAAVNDGIELNDGSFARIFLHSINVHSMDVEVSNSCVHMRVA